MRSFLFSQLFPIINPYTPHIPPDALGPNEAKWSGAKRSKDYEYVKANSRYGGRIAKRCEPKQGRNNQCACGSGKKYKHCCGEK